MTDQCINCTLRGDLDNCLKSECFQHENWMVIALKERHQQLIAEAVEKAKKETIQIELGNGDKIISDIFDPDNHEWAGIAISEGNCPVGEVADLPDIKTVSDLNPIITIVTSNINSINVIIEACNRAKKHIIDNTDNGRD